MLNAFGAGRGVMQIGMRSVREADKGAGLGEIDDGHVFGLRGFRDRRDIPLGGPAPARVEAVDAEAVGQTFRRVAPARGQTQEGAITHDQGRAVSHRGIGDTRPSAVRVY